MFERITRREEFDLFAAWIAISIAFTFIFIAPGGIISGSGVDPIRALLLFGISLVTVGIGFILHEMAHKFTAIRYGFWAEFRKNNMMLLIAVLLAAFVGVVFAAPGATVIYTNPAEGRNISREQNGIISVAGPLVNLVLCIPFAGLYFAGGSFVHAAPLLTTVGLIGIQVNAMIATFNMLPVSVLDGKKVAQWNIGVFLVLFIVAIATLYASYVYL
ncbi:MAG TPA: site-2 protease family protein [Methanoregula sp.]|nr:site-2 protease family protein [Methanoregula sp.]